MCLRMIISTNAVQVVNDHVYLWVEIPIWLLKKSYKKKDIPLDSFWKTLQKSGESETGSENKRLSDDDDDDSYEHSM